MKIITRVLMVLKARKTNVNLFLLIREIYHKAEASIAATSSTKEKTIMWNQKLGHMPEKNLKILPYQKLLYGLTKVSLPFYEDCIIS
jgi:hypothetical protein